MAVIYGWTFVNYNVAYTWSGGVEAQYLLWENFWARRIDAYIFTDAGTTPRLTNANEMLDVGDIVNELMILMNLYLKSSNTEAPMETGLYDSVGFPSFIGDPLANDGKGTGHYGVLNKLRRKHSESETRVDSLRLGVNPEDNPFSGSGVYL